MTVCLAASWSYAQMECNQNLSIDLDSDGTGTFIASDLVPNAEFLLTQGTLTYFVFPDTYGEFTSATDVVEVACENTGYPAFVVELKDGETLLENCSGELIIMSPNGGCPGTPPSYCDDPNFNCLTIVEGYSILEAEGEIFATDFALCSEAEGCGNYTIAFGTTNQAPSLNFLPSISLDGITQYKTPVVIFYSDPSSTVFVQSYIYVWEFVDCLIRAEYMPRLGLEADGELSLTSADLFSSDAGCDDVSFSITEYDAFQPGPWIENQTIDCDDIGRKLVWFRNNESDVIVTKEVQILDPLEACGTVLGPNDKLLSLANNGPQGTFFNHQLELNGSPVERHPSGIGWVIRDTDVLDGQNVLEFISDEFSPNGISTLDQVRGLRIILRDEYDDPIQAVLFDIDQSGYDGINDLITMRQVILGQSQGEGVADAYFFHEDHQFEADFNPFDFENTYTSYKFEKADFASTNFAFNAFKNGDLNESAVPGLKSEEQATTRSAASYLVSDLSVQAGEEFTFKMRYESESKFSGLLAALIGDGIEFHDLMSAEEGVDFNVINGNEIRISFVDPVGDATIDEIEFLISATSSKDGDLVDLLGLKAGFPQEVVDENGTVIVIDDLGEISILDINDASQLNVSLFPNPAQNFISIQGDLDVVDQVRVFDMTGRQVISIASPAIGQLINIDDLPDGLYTLEVSSKQRWQKVSFVKS